jgi:hypothetical protein
MRLINCSTLQLDNFSGDKIPSYAILSHTWGDDEVSFAEFSLGQGKRRSGYRKILFTCRQAIKHGLKYAWIDTCCIDKSSSAELSEAINSMFTWYKNARYCYAYLSDVSKARMKFDFPRSRWFTRGWTLQELLAPQQAIFYDHEWLPLGTRLQHSEWISTITGIDKTALDIPGDTRPRGAILGSFCVVKRMSWASRRQTTRAEDMSYCLLGIFNINMPLLYGEGEQAFVRLQEEIIRRNGDDSILAWGLKPRIEHPLGLVPDKVKDAMKGGTSPYSQSTDILAKSPKDFVHCAGLGYGVGSTSPFRLTNTGLRIELPLVPIYETKEFTATDGFDESIGLLSCSTGSHSRFLGILLRLERRDEKGNARVKRVEIRYLESPYSTIVIGPRAAAKSVLQKVTIARSDESQGVRNSALRLRQVCINESSAFRATNYRVKSGTAWNIAEPETPGYGYNQVWDPLSKVLTIEEEKSARYLAEFCFESSSRRRDTMFSVFIHTVSNKALALKGSSFSGDDRRNIYRDLEEDYAVTYKGAKRHEPEEVILHRGGGDSYLVNVGTRMRIVYNHQLFEVKLDVKPYARQQYTSVT